ncbi:hypothetical protein ACGF12_16445 [Kitasatospora sp. NPDC048296]|uniref:hypothetical protein n=1 Tax=Kitasatospora sp. NPDC048296 TaxID=3364048 RepID=UPI00371B1E25
MNGKIIRHPGMRRASGLTAAALMGVVTLLGSGGTALADAAPTALSAPRYVEQSNPPAPNSFDAGYQVGLQLGKQLANSDFKNGQMSRAFTKYPTVSGNDPSYSYQNGVLQGTKNGYEEEISALIGGAVGPALPSHPSPEHPYYTGPNAGGSTPNSPNTTGPNAGGSTPNSPNTTGPNMGGSTPNSPNTTGPNMGGSTPNSPNTTGQSPTGPVQPVV